MFTESLSMYFEIPFYGHKNVRSTHQKTIEITSDSELSVNGDCIIGINSKFGCSGIPEKIKSLLQNSKALVNITISVNGLNFKIKGTGHKDLILSHPHDIVIRKSSFLCPRTLAINCDKASHEIPKKMVRMLQDPNTKGIFAIDVSIQR